MLLNAAHAIDHLVLLIFATAVGAIATDFGFARWEDLMPYAAGSFLLFGLGSVPAGRLGDHWGRRAMMLVFLFGIGRRMPARGSHAKTRGSSHLHWGWWAPSRPSTIRSASRCSCRGPPVPAP